MFEKTSYFRFLINDFRLYIITLDYADRETKRRGQKS